MSLMCWNCRGSGNPRTVNLLQNWSRRIKPSVLFVCETMCLKNVMEDLRWTLGFPNAIGVDANGNSGGLCIYWKAEVDFRLRSFSDHHIVGSIHNIGSTVWNFCGIYGWARGSEKYRTWDLMRTICRMYSGPFLFGGDFNEVLESKEKRGGAEVNFRSMANFNQVLRDCELMDIGSQGTFFTWERGKDVNTRIQERLDRFLVSVSWFDMFPKAEAKGLTRIGSDHCPIMIDLSGLQRTDSKSSRPRRIEPHWIKDQMTMRAVEIAGQITKKGLSFRNYVLAQIVFINKVPS